MIKNVFLSFIIIGLASTSFYLSVNAETLSDKETQSTMVKGKFLCGSVPAKNVVIRLLRIDSKDSTDVLNEETSNDKGEFVIKGDTSTFRPHLAQIDPLLKIYHKCSKDDSELTSYRVIVLRYPRSYVTKGKFPHKTYNIGTYNLQIEYPHEKTVDKIEKL